MPITLGTVLMTVSSLSQQTSKLNNKLTGSHSHLYFPTVHWMSLIVSSLCWARPSNSLTWHPLTWDTWTHGALHWGNLCSWCNTGSFLYSYWGLLDPSRVSGYHPPSSLALWSWSILCVCEEVWWFLHQEVIVVLPYMLPWSCWDWSWGCWTST